MRVFLIRFTINMTTSLAKVLVLWFLVGLALADSVPKSKSRIKVCCPDSKLSYREDWGYTDVRRDAHLFWWLYYRSDSPIDANRPLILWLQGGPGSSGVGFGNFEELGPLDQNLKPRNTTWLQAADLVFIDNPVGTGFSYVDNNSALTTNVEQISADLVAWATEFFNTKHPEYQTRPFYIFCESYGGKMTASFAQYLWQASQKGDVKVNLKGVALGDSWISAMDYVNTWGSYLYYTSYLDEVGLISCISQSAKCQALVDSEKWTEATTCWSEMETLIGNLTNDVSWYNILKEGNTDPWSSTALQFPVMDMTPTDKAQIVKQNLMQSKKRHLYGYTASLADLMNGPIKQKLEIIPADVKWGGQAGQVFEYQADDFMKPVINVVSVDYLLQKTNLSVTVFNGQLDLICNTRGTDLWIQRLTWPGLKPYNDAPRTPFSIESSPDQTAGFYKSYERFSFYWIMRAGHMVAHDAAEAALKMVSNIVSKG